MTKKIKQPLALVFVLLLVCAFCFPIFAQVGFSAKAAEVNTLNILNWGDYIDESVINDFKREYAAKYPGIKVYYETADTNEMMLTKVEKGDAQIDLLCPSDYAIEKLFNKGYIQKLDRTKLANYGNLDSRLADKIVHVFTGLKEGDKDVKLSDYLVPYMMGTLGILYNTNFIKKEDAEKAGYGLLWNSTNLDNVKGKVLMKDSVRDSSVAAILYMKEQGTLPEQYKDWSVEKLINCSEDAMLKAVEQKLIEQKKVLSKYEVDDGKGEMETGKATVNLAWSGDAVATMNKTDALDYFIPKVGGNIWYDGWVMTKKCQNTALAHDFLDFLLRADIAARNAVEIGYTSSASKEALLANKKAVEVLKEEYGDNLEEDFFGNEIIYPNLEDPSLAVMRDYGARSSQFQTMWERVKHTSNVPKILGIVFGVLGGVILIVIIVVVVLKKTSRKGKLVKPAAKDEKAPSEAETEETEEDDEDEEE